jgi:hypothetical protein
MRVVSTHSSDGSGRGAVDRYPCDRVTQAHIREMFKESQGTTESDIKARQRRIENARRYVHWANTAGMVLSPTGNRGL